MIKRVLFLGEGDLSGPARYLAGALHWMGLPFDHRPDQAPIPKAWQKDGRYQAILLSDYRYASFSPASRRWLIQQVHQGVGLVMIGGWASFTGLVGGYAGTPIEELLPVRCVSGDDRVNCPSGAVLFPLKNPPVVCGYHKARPKAGTYTLLEFRELRFTNGRPEFGLAHPALVIGQAGRGRTAAFLTDCAPHWAGGLVDWGAKRVTVHIPGAGTIEVGNQYLHFLKQLVMRVMTR